ncbi:MAG: hypothetical protein M3N30_00595 [Bacteroidota bacterium]|nr:hypothetical protein [Bacteroidota bacterium]
MKYIASLFILFFFLEQGSEAQKFRTTNAQKLVIAGNDSLHPDNNTQQTVISGYGSAFYQRNFNTYQSFVTLERAVLFVGHQFSQKISFFSELEVENAKVEGGISNNAEISMEQAFLKFNLNAHQYIIAGLFTPRIGILNENHLPVNFNGVERPMVESLIIPATWRELGIGFYGNSEKIPLNYSFALMNGLEGQNFEHGSGIRGGRAEGNLASANNIALAVAVQYLWKNFKFQVSAYSGGTVTLSPKGSDSLGLNSGAFGTPIYLGEADIQYEQNAWSGKAMGTFISYPEAGKMNTVYGNNTATGMYGAYIEIAYNWLYKKSAKESFISFARLEALNMNSDIASNGKGIYDGTENQTHLIMGFGYLPLPNVVIKADVRLMHTGPQNQALVINPAPDALPYQQSNQFLNLGIGYSF